MYVGALAAVPYTVQKYSSCVCVLMEEEREGGKTVCKSKRVCVMKAEKEGENIVCQSKGACVV